MPTPLAGLLLGLDSFIVAAALGMAGMPATWRWRLALAFGVCDGLASMVGACLYLGTMLAWHEWLGPPAVGGYGAYVLLLAWRSRRLAGSAGARGWPAFALPVCLSIDNLVAGAGTAGGDAVLAAVVCGAVSGALAFVGLRLGAGVARRASVRGAWIGGVALIAVAAALVCKESLSSL